MQITKKRAAAVGAGAALCLIAGGTAFAFWTTTGAGTGSAATGNTSPVTIVAAGSVSGLYPGGPAQGLSGTFNNPNPGKVYVNQVSITISGISPAQTNLGLPACTASDFTIVDPGATAAEVPSGNGVGSWTGGSIALKDTAANQDNCKGVTVSLAFASN